jgi:tetratricopeptide (TPR) repeat protein
MDDSFLSSEEFDERAHRLYDAGEYDQALELLRDGLRCHPDSAELHVGVGYVRMAREEFAWARHAFEAAIAAEEEHEEAWVGMGETLLKFGDRDGALGCFARVDVLGGGDDLELGLSMGRALYREGLFTEARARFARLAAAHPEDAEVAAARGYTLHALGDDVGARRELRRALRACSSCTRPGSTSRTCCTTTATPRARCASWSGYPPPSTGTASRSGDTWSSRPACRASARKIPR